MARLRKQARRNARLQYAPVRRDLKRQKKEARQTYRTTRSGERQAARGIQAQVEQALRGVKGDYREAGAEARLADKLGGAEGTGIFAQADALSRRQTKRGLAESIAGELADLRAREVQAEEAAAYGTRAARGQLQSTLGGIAGERAATSREQGQFALSELSRLKDEAAAARREEQSLENERARIAISEGNLDVSRGNLRLSRKKERHQERERAYDRAHPGSSDGGGAPDSVHSQNLKQEIIDARAEYERQMNKGVSLAKIAKNARKNGVSDVVLNAASSLATKGYIPGNGLAELRNAGARHIPKNWRTSSGGGSGGGLQGFLNRLGG